VAAWALFQEIEAAGGTAAALEGGLIQRRVAGVRAERETAVACRSDALTGTSDFPNLAEIPVSVLDVVPVPFADWQRSAAITFEPLRQIRLAEPFERLRDASDRALAATGARPKIFLANLGTPSDFVTRATFAKNFFEAGGIEAVNEQGFASPDSLVAAFKASGARLACLSSSDDIYVRDGGAAGQALAGASARHIYVVASPKTSGPLEEVVQTFIYRGCDALAILSAAHDMIGLK
jgi:methylmalonyl-CoA mutase